MPRANDPRVYTNALLQGALLPEAGQRVLALGVAAELAVAWANAVGSPGAVLAVTHWLLQCGPTTACWISAVARASWGWAPRGWPPLAASP